MVIVLAVHRDERHRFSKVPADRIRLLAGLGVEGDAHLGTTVQHRSRVARDPSQPNLRQVHLLHDELLAELAEQGYDVPPGGLGENVTTRGVDLLSLPTGARLHLGAQAIVEVTGLRNPCWQIDAYRKGVLARVVGRGADGSVVRRAGVMGVVIEGGVVHPGDPLGVVLPDSPAAPLAPV